MAYTQRHSLSRQMPENRDLEHCQDSSASYPEYFVDDVAKQAGHEVVRLPVAHCELNPIEMAWSQMKHYIKTHNLKFTLSEMEWLTHIAFTTVTPDHWKSLLAHVKEKVVHHYWEADGLQMGGVYHIDGRGLGI